MHAVVAWILHFMLAQVTPGTPSAYPYAQETSEEAVSRFDSIAMDIAEVSFDPAERPIFPGDNGRLETAALIASIARYEGGGFRKDVDYGVGPDSRGDHGNSVCLMQINVGNRKTMEGYTKDDLLSDRRKCFRAGLHMAAYSFNACRKQPFDERLRLYASGRCDRGLMESRVRVMTGILWFYANRPHFTDTEVLAYVRSEHDREQVAADNNPTNSLAQTEVLIRPSGHD